MTTHRAQVLKGPKPNPPGKPWAETRWPTAPWSTPPWSTSPWPQTCRRDMSARPHRVGG
jgi:hypothetical protein